VVWDTAIRWRFEKLGKWKHRDRWFQPSWQDHFPQFLRKNKHMKQTTTYKSTIMTDSAKSCFFPYIPPCVLKPLTRRLYALSNLKLQFSIPTVPQELNVNTMATSCKLQVNIGIFMHLELHWPLFWGVGLPFYGIPFMDHCIAETPQTTRSTRGNTTTVLNRAREPRWKDTPRWKDDTPPGNEHHHVQLPKLEESWTLINKAILGEWVFPYSLQKVRIPPF